LKSPVWMKKKALHRNGWKACGAVAGRLWTDQSCR
jgi:hypothetical protein